MAPQTATEIVVDLLAWQAATDRTDATANAGFLLDLCVEDLTALTAAIARTTTMTAELREQHRAAENIRAKVQTCAAAITGGRTTAGTVADLRRAATPRPRGRNDTHPIEVRYVCRSRLLAKGNW